MTPRRSGSVWKIYQGLCFSYGPYTNMVKFVNLVATDTNFITAWLQKLVGTDADFIKGKHFFKRVSFPQVGDIGWWHNGKTGHMAIYDPNSGMCGKEKNIAGNVWSASNSKGPPFGAAHSSWYDKEYNMPTQWHRYWES